MNPKDRIHKDWQPVIPFLRQGQLQTLNSEVLPNISFQPHPKDIFRVFEMKPKDVKVVILGQDPYPTPNDAVGLSFVPGTPKLPVSLRNIYKEVENSMSDGENVYMPNIHRWTDDGVFLLNTALTVETGKAGSHLKYWEEFTKQVIRHLSRVSPCIWILWGAKAQQYANCIYKPFSVKGYDRNTIEDIPITPDNNYVLMAPHPAAEAYAGGNAGFFGCDHFYQANVVLKLRGKEEISW